MRIDIYELTGVDSRDIRKIERVLGLHEGTINIEAAPPRASDNGDFFVKIGFFDNGKKLS